MLTAGERPKELARRDHSYESDAFVNSIVKVLSRSYPVNPLCHRPDWPIPKQHTRKNPARRIRWRRGNSAEGEKFTREQTAARKLAEEYFQRYPKDRYQTEVESWRNLQSANIEFTMKRLREPIEG
jgi:hypothetical protein